MAKSVNVDVIQNEEKMKKINKLIDEIKFGEITETEKNKLITMAYSEILKLKNVYYGKLSKYANKVDSCDNGSYDGFLEVYSLPQELGMTIVNEAFVVALDKYEMKGSKFMNLFFVTLGNVANKLGHIYSNKVVDPKSEISRWRSAKAKDLIKKIREDVEIRHKLPDNILSREAFYKELKKIGVEGKIADEMVNKVFGVSAEEIFHSRDIELDKENSPMWKDESYSIDDKMDDTIIVIYEVFRHVAAMANDKRTRKTKVYKSYVKICTTYKLYDQELCDVDKLKELLTQEVLNWLRANKVLEAKGRFIDKAYISIDRKVREAKKRGTDISESVINTRISNAHKNIENQFPGRIIGRYKYYDGDGNIHSNIEWNKINELKDICNEDYYYKARENIANVERAYLESMAYLSKKGKF